MRTKNFDFQLAKELNLTMENESQIYSKEGSMAKNYAKKFKSGKFNFSKAHQGIKNQIVIPFAREYRHKFGTEIPSDVRNAVSKSRLRAVLKRIKEDEF